jgi:CheY-like chemotaxis protein
MNRQRILVVEDNRDNMVLITDMLEALNYAVLTAADGQKGIDTAIADGPDLILMDLSLPVVDGWTAAGVIKSHPARKQIPIIALTAHAMSGDRERALAAGCDDYVSKPINFSELTTKITQLLNARKPA